MEDNTKVADLPVGMATEFIEIKKSKEGLKYFAKKDLKKESLLMVEEPFAAFPDLKTIEKQNFCSRCFSLSSKKLPFTCSICKVGYCSQICKTDAENSHKSLCNKIEGNGSEYLRLIPLCEEKGGYYTIPIVVAKIAFRLNDQGQEKEDWIKINSLKGKEEMGEEFIEETWPLFEQEILPLLSSKERFNLDWYKRTCSTLATFGCILPLFPLESEEEKEQEGMPLYMGLFPLFSLGLECSCSPNTILSPIKSGSSSSIVVLTSQKVKKGEELTAFGDSCECPKCLSEKLSQLKV